MQFKNIDDANKSIEAMNGKADLGSSALAISVHKKKQERSVTNIFTNLFVSNFDAQTTKEELQKLFEEFGEIESVHIPLEQGEKVNRYGFVCFKQPADAVKALG